jgi:hypothetical protein
MKQPLQVLSLGAGVQSSCVFLMSCCGDLPKLDAAIFADTQWEPWWVYKSLEMLRTAGERAGIPLYIRSKGNLREHTLDRFVLGSNGGRYATMPLFTLDENGHKGMLRRQCTREYKAEVVDACIRKEILGLARYARAPKDAVDQWYGISSDEENRIRASRHRWVNYVYPLCGVPHDMLPMAMQRSDCMAWLQQNFPGQEFRRSSCVGCPYHSDDEWRAIKEDYVSWRDAVEVDHAVRHPHGLNSAAYLHRTCRPLEEVDLNSEADRQVHAWDRECLGLCGV